MTELKIKSKLFKVGNSYGLRVRSAYIEDGNLEEGQEYVAVILRKVKKDSASSKLGNGPVDYYSLPLLSNSLIKTFNRGVFA